MKWINVTDRLPPEGKKVIFLTDHYCLFPDNIYTGIKRGDEMYYSQRWSLDFDYIQFKYVTHWMLIPEKPES